MLSSSSSANYAETNPMRFDHRSLTSAHAAVSRLREVAAGADVALDPCTLMDLATHEQALFPAQLLIGG